MKNYFQLVIVASLLLVTMACDYWHEKDYYINNQSDDSLEVSIRIYPSKDSTTLAPPNQTTLLYTHGYPYGSVGVDDDRYNDPISELWISNKDTSIFFEESEWDYYLLDKYHAEYHIVIDSTSLN